MLNRIEDENRESASAIFRKIGWRYNPDCFWETMTQAEFLVLQNRVEEAEKVFEDYAKRKNIDEGSLQSSLDQLKAFAHFTEDESAIEFLEFLKEFAKSEL
jgi:tRNA 2-selenouridine synthase SelU